MIIETRNRDPIDQVLEEFTVEVAEEVGLNPDKLLIYPSSNDGGVYAGRIDGMPIIGLAEQNRYLIAHEIGHDRYKQEFIGEFPREDLETNENGEIITEGVLERNDSLEVLINEVFGENIAREHVEDKENMYERNPLDYVRTHLESFEQSVSPEHNNKPILEQRPTDEGKYFRNPKNYKDYEVLGDEIVSRLEREDKEANEELKELIYNTWAERIHKTVIRGKNDIIYDSVVPFLEDEINTDKVIWHSLEEEFGEKVREAINKNFGFITLEIAKNCRSKAARGRLKDEIPSNSILEVFSTSNPSHFSSVLQSGNLDSLRTDYSHQVGNYVGRILYDIGVSHKDLEENEEKFEELVRRSLDLALEMGKYERDFYNKEDYKEGIEFLAKDVGLLNFNS